MRKLSNLVIVLALVFSLPLGVQAQYVRYRLPEGTRITYQDETYQAFNLGEYQELLRMDSDLRYLTQLRDNYSIQVVELTNAVNQAEAAVAVAQDSIELLQAERERLHELWVEENRLRHLAEQRPVWDWVPWALTGVLAVAVVVLGIVIGVM